ncbi:MAG TPA: hypothetical protein VIV15_11375, partial [Anaerolineales bacterium]
MDVTRGVTAAHRGEGTSLAYLPPELPAVADLRVTTALLDGAAAMGEKPFVGIATTRDAFHRKDQALAELLSKEGDIRVEGGRTRGVPPRTPLRGHGCGRGRCWASTRTSSCRGR